MEVVAAVIKQDGRYLLCQRPLGKSMENHWEFPGGKVEPGESNEQALIRECIEELGICLEVHTLLLTVDRNENGRELIIHFYECSIEKGVPQRLEHQDMHWVAIKDLKEYPLCKSDQLFVDWLLNEKESK